LVHDPARALRLAAERHATVIAVAYYTVAPSFARESSMIVLGSLAGALAGLVTPNQPGQADAEVSAGRCNLLTPRSG